MRSMYLPNSQEAARLGMPPFVFNEIPIVGDRTNGEVFPQAEGEFFYVEKCDKPIAVAFVNGSISQARIVREGDTVRGPFKGIIVFHDNYSAVANTRSVFRFITSKTSVVENNSIYPSCARPMPYNTTATVGPAVNSLRTRVVPILKGSRYFRTARLSDAFVVAVAMIGAVTMRVQFRTIDNVILSIDPVTHNNVAFTTAAGSDGDLQIQVPLLGPNVALQFQTVFDFSGLAIPALAETAEFILSTGALNNVTMDPAANEGTGNSRAYFIFG